MNSQEERSETEELALSHTQKTMAEAGGRVCQKLGLPRTMGQIYGLLYMALQPLSLDDLAELLSISKASASNGTRQLLSWGAIRQVWVPGNRRDHFEVNGDIGHLLRGFFTDFVKPRIDYSKNKIDALVSQLEDDFQAGRFSLDEYSMLLERLKHLGKLQRRIKRIAPVAEKML